MDKTTQTELISKAKPVTLAVFDVDGILTSGQLLFLPDGQEVKQFNTLDGLGIKLLLNAGIEVAIITGRTSPQVSKRAESLGINYLIQGREDKLTALQSIWAETNHTAGTTAYIGDDLPDLAAIRACSLGASVPNGHEFVTSHADWVTRRKGGEGAAREFCELILTAQGKLDKMLQEYL